MLGYRPRNPSPYYDCIIICQSRLDKLKNLILAQNGCLFSNHSSSGLFVFFVSVLLTWQLWKQLRLVRGRPWLGVASPTCASDSFWRGAPLGCVEERLPGWWSLPSEAGEKMNTTKRRVIFIENRTSSIIALTETLQDVLICVCWLQDCVKSINNLIATDDGQYYRIAGNIGRFKFGRSVLRDRHTYIHE